MDIHQNARCFRRTGHGAATTEPAETVDALDLVARVLAHIPDPRRHRPLLRRVLQCGAG